MIIVDEQNNIIENPDLTQGILIDCLILDPKVGPIDNMKKFSYLEEDYIPAKRYIKKDPREELELQLNGAQQKLAETDSQIASCMEDLLKVTKIEDLIPALAQIRESNIAVLKEREKIRAAIDEMQVATVPMTETDYAKIFE